MKQTLLLVCCLFTFSVFSQTEDSPEIRSQLDSLKKRCDAFIDENNFSQAHQVMQQARQICLQSFGESSTPYAELLNLKARINLNEGDLPSATIHCQQSMDILKKVSNNLHPAYLTNLLYLMDISYQTGHYESAQQYLEEALPLARKRWGSEHIQYIQYKMNLGILYRVNGHLDKAEETLVSVSQEMLQTLGRDHPAYGGCLVNLGLLFSDIGAYDRCEQTYLEAKSIYEQQENGTSNPIYSYILQNLGILYWQQDMFDKAEPVYLQSLPVIKSNTGPDKLDYASALINVGLLYIDMHQFEKAEPRLLEARSIFEEKLKNREHPYYLNGMHNLANVFAETNRMDQAEKVNLEVLSIRERTLGKYHEDYAQSMINLIRLYIETEDKEKAIPYLLDLYASIQHQVQLAFSFLSEKEKESFLQTKLKKKISLLQSAGMILDSPQVNDMLYDLSLLMKGARLQAGISTMEYVLKQEDSASVNIYRQLLDCRNKLAAQYSLEVNMRNGIEELEDTQQDLEKKLARRSSYFRREQAAAHVTNQSVRNTLQPNEIAIEFIHFQTEDLLQQTHVQYAALVISPTKEHVQFVPLFEELKLDQLLDESIERRMDYVDELYGMADRGLSPAKEKKQGLYELVWQPLEPFLPGVHTIHLSPSGLLHRLNLGAIVQNGESTISDDFNVHILSNTRLLVREKSEQLTREQSALVFGGVYYDFDSTAMENAVRSLGIPVGDRQALHPKGGSGNIFHQARSGRNGWQFLKWTQKEGEKVSSLLGSHGYHVHFSSGFNATEEAFKLAGTNGQTPTAIHLATHGFFFPDQDDASNGQDNEAPIQSMFRSGLLLAGANKAWKEGVELPGYEDGILTAYEISQLNLAGAEIVTLSACETGLGDIKGSEGVFGLQRAFKMAGVRYLIMSLWQVPDFQTQDLMTTFYSKWLEEGMPIPEAFRSAQLDMRDKYQSPYFWAGFVLVE